LAPLFVLGAASGFMTAWLEKHHVGASGPEWSLSLLQRCLLAGRVLWFYAGKMFWPHPLIFIYPRWEIDSGAWWQYLFPSAALAVLLALWSLRSRIGRGPLVAVLCFAGTLVPALGFFDVFPFRYSFVADHFQYLACIGLISLAVSTGTAICKRAGQWGRNFATVAAAIVLLIMGASTWRQTHIYRDVETLWRDTLAKNPQCWMAHNNLGNALLQAGKVPEAIGHLEQALRIKADYAEAHNNMGMALVRLGKVSEAIGHLEQALRINPDSAEAHNNLGDALLQTGKVQEAIGQLQQALRIAPNFAEAHSNLGDAFLRSGKVREAIEQCQQAVQLKPDFAEAHFTLGSALEQAGRVQEAIKHYEEVLRIKPDSIEAQNNLAWLLATHAPRDGGNPVRGLGLAQRVCELTGNRAAPYLDTLAAAYAATGQFSNAVATAEKAIDLSRAARQPQIVKEIEPRLQLYRSGRAYRESVGVTSPRNR